MTETTLGTIGKWIEDPASSQYASPIFQTSFQLEEPVCEGEIRVSGLGFYNLYLNGHLLDDALLQPAFSKYDSFVNFNILDCQKILPHLQTGQNTLTAVLGNGWFNEPGEDCFDFEHAAWKHRPILLCEVYCNGRCIEATGSHWLCGDSPLQFNSVRLGEDWDFTRPEPVFARRASVSKGPGGVLREQLAPPIRVVEYRPPVRVSGGLYDFGKNLAGDVELSLKGPFGSLVQVAYGERLDLYGRLDQTMVKRHPTIPRIQTDRLTLSGKTDHWHSNFSYKGFRYVEITGDCQVLSIRARVFYSDFQEVGSFHCSDEDLNALMEAARHSTRTNFHHIPTDCPHREKNGWTGDAHVSVEQALFQFDMEKGYLSYLDSLAACQRANGELPCIAPTSVYGYNFQSGPTWDAALILIPWELYQFSGKTEILARYYDGMKRYLGYTALLSEDGICQSGLGDFLPDDGVPVCPDGLILSAFVAHLADVLSRIARVLGLKKDADAFKDRAGFVREAIKSRYVGRCAKTASYLTTVLQFDLSETPREDAALLNALILENGCRAGGGLFTSVWGLDVLTRYGYFETAFSVVKNKEKPGWLAMLKDGGGTLWEYWGGEKGSLNHHMRSPVAAWMYKTLAGIQPDPAHPAFQMVRIEPRFSPELLSLDAWHCTPRGVLRVQYDEESISITLPPETECVLCLDGKERRLKESVSLKRR